MKTDNMRVLVRDQRGLDAVRAYLHAVETEDLGALKRLMEPEVELVHANYPPVVGRAAAASMIEGYLEVVDGVEFEVRTVMGDEGLFFIEKVNVARAPSGHSARIRVVTILELGSGGLLRSVRIYADTGDLFRKLGTAPDHP